jgi:AAT family amino acid transporter
VIPTFTAVDFVSFYIEIPAMLVMFIFWRLVKRPGPHSLHPGVSGTTRGGEASRRAWYSDLVDTKSVDLSRDEYVEGVIDRADDEQRITRMKGNKRFLWKLYYWIA